MQYYNVYRVENIVKQLWMIYYYLHPQQRANGKVRRSIKSITQEWPQECLKWNHNTWEMLYLQKIG